MPLTLYMDVHIPRVVTDTLRRRGLDVLTSQEDGTAILTDESLLARAAILGRLLYTQDQDFLQIASEWQQQGRAFPGIIFSQQRLSLGRMIDDLELILTCCDLAELTNRVTFLPLR